MKFKIATAMLAAAAASVSAEDLTVYTYESFVSEWGPGPVLEEKFEAQCNCNINFVGLEDGVALLNRLRLEGTQTQADIILGIDDALLSEAKSLGLFAEHKQALSGLALPYAWRDDQFVPYDFGHFAFVYDDTKVTDVPTSLRALVEESDLSVIYQDPRVSTPGQGLMLWMKSVFGEEAADAWQKLQAKTVTVTPGWSEAYALFLEGKSDMVLSYVTSPAYHMTYEDTEQYKAADFSEGHYVQIEIAAALKSSDNLALAQSFLGFLISQSAQDVFAGTNWMWPVLASAEKPEAFEKLNQPETLYFRSDDVAKNRKAWINEWRNAASQ